VTTQTIRTAWVFFELIHVLIFNIVMSITHLVVGTILYVGLGSIVTSIASLSIAFGCAEGCGSESLYIASVTVIIWLLVVFRISKNIHKYYKSRK
jgi:hypothetical protein